MGSYHWAKLYIEILYDYKMAGLGDHLWRRTVELVLLAKEYDAEGYLPPLPEMAFKLHTDPEILEAELSDLANSKITERRQDGWYLINFAERQGPMSDAERMSRMRSRQKKGEYYTAETPALRTSDDTVTKRNTDKIRIDKIRKDKNPPPPSARITHQELPPEAQPDFDRADLRRRVSNAIVKLAAETIVPATDKWLMVEDYADEWIDMGVTEEDIPGFRAYWDGLTDRPYNGAPYLKSIGSHFKAYWQSRTVRATGGVNPDGSIGRVNWEALHG